MADPKQEKQAAADKAAAEKEAKKAEAAAAKKAAAEKVAADKAEAEEEKQAKADAKVEQGGITVRSRVNMLAKDGTMMVAGKHCTLSFGEHQRLKDDKRHQKKPFFDPA